MSSETRCLVKLSSKNVGLGNKLAEIILLVGGFEIQKAADSRRPDLLIHDLTGKPGEELDTIQILLDSQRIGQVFLTGESPDADVLMKAMRIGVKEFFPQPINEQQVKKALQRFRETHRENGRLKTKKKGQVIGVFGCKGGVGTTTLAIQLSEAGWLENLDEWSEELAVEIAKNEKITELTQEHWDIINTAREYF